MSEDEKNDFEPEMEKDGSVSDEEKDHSTSDAEQDKPSAGTATVPEDGLVIAASELPDLIPVIPIRPRPAFPNVDSHLSTVRFETFTNSANSFCVIPKISRTSFISSAVTPVGVMYFAIA